eukprot:337707_1
MREEIKVNGGIKNGYKCIKVLPKQCNGVIFSQDLIHEGCKMLSKKKNKYKYILKTEIVVTRQPNISNRSGFAISCEESLDYKRCLNYFIEAQRQELNGNKTKANELYERSLSIRYSYPKTLINEHNYHNKDKYLKLHCNIAQIWFIIFGYSYNREIECCSFLFPNQLYNLYLKWKLKINKKYFRVPRKTKVIYQVNKYQFIARQINDQYGFGNTEHPFIPKIKTRYGCYTLFEFPDLNFFEHHRIECIRVAAIYALYLMSHEINSKYFVVEYNSFTQNIIAIPLNQLLSDVFYNKQCHGKYFKIKKQKQQTFKNEKQTFEKQREDNNRYWYTTEGGLDYYKVNVQKPYMTNVKRSMINAYKQILALGLNLYTYSWPNMDKIQEQIHERNVFVTVANAYKQVLALGLELDSYSWNNKDDIKEILNKKQHERKCEQEQKATELYEYFNDNVDRSYMTICHGSEFLGGIGILSDKRFYFDSDKKQKFLFRQMNIEKFNRDYNHDYYHSKYYPESLDGKIDNDIVNFGSKNCKMSKLDYFNDISNNNINIHKTRITTAYNYKCKRIYDIKTCNNLIFDFEKNNLEIIEDKKIYDGDKCKYCYTLNLTIGSNIDSMMKECIGTQLYWRTVVTDTVKSKYKATFYLKQEYVENMNKNTMQNILLNTLSFNRVKVLTMEIKAGPLSLGKLVTIEFTLIFWLGKSHKIRELKKIILQAFASTFDTEMEYVRGECLQNDLFELDVINDKYIDEEINNWRNMKDTAKFCIVNIENLKNNKSGYDLSYNHAGNSCDICGNESKIDDDCPTWDNFKFAHYSGYSHMKHLHISTIKDNYNNKLFMWVSYNGVNSL